MGIGSILLCLQCGRLRPQTVDLVGNYCHVLISFRLCALQRRNFLTGFGQLGCIHLDLRSNGRQLLLIRILTVFQIGKLRVGRCLRIADRLQPDFVLAHQALGSKYLLFCLLQLLLGGVQLEIHLICQAAGLLELGFCLLELLDQFLFLGSQLVQFVGAA